MLRTKIKSSWLWVIGALAVTSFVVVAVLEEIWDSVRPRKEGDVWYDIKSSEFKRLENGVPIGYDPREGL